jgi:hypothetical protein
MPVLTSEFVHKMAVILNANIKREIVVYSPK